MIRLIRNCLPLIGLHQFSGITKADNAHDQPLQCQQYHDLFLKARGGAAPDMPRACGGKTPVYLPKEASDVVFKQSGHTHAQHRLQQMEATRAILLEQKSLHLVIPKATVCGDFLLEERLPIDGEHISNISTYVTDPDLFDAAVREMVVFFSKAYLSDLITPSFLVKHPIGSIVGDTVRYDNLPLYIEEENGIKQGKIGLVDLEHIHFLHMEEENDIQQSKRRFVREYPRTPPSYQQRVLDLIRIFPYHENIIISEAKNVHKLSQEEIWELQNEARRGKKYIHKLYTEHSRFLAQKGITRENGSELFTFSEKKIVIAQAVQAKFPIGPAKLSSDDVRRMFFRNIILHTLDLSAFEYAVSCINASRAQAIQKISSGIVRILLQNIETDIQECQQEWSKCISKEHVLSHVITRSAYTPLNIKNVDDFQEHERESIQELIKEACNLGLLQKDDSLYVLNAARMAILEELKREGCICNFTIDRDLNMIWIQF